jgi:protein TonB
MTFHISRDGRLLERRIVKSSGHERLDIAAISALSLCPFKPQTIDGIPVDSWMKMQYVWKLE